MVYNTQSLKVKYKNYSNINQKVSLESKKDNLLRIKRGLYTDNLKIDAPIIANMCYSPSYISYEFALSYYGLIPEYVSTYTSATFGKKNNKKYFLNEVTFEYRSIPDEAFPHEVIFKANEEGIRYKIASKEKAFCDTLYSKYPVRSIKDLKVLLFEDLRIDEGEFKKLNFDIILSLVNKYHSNTLLTLAKYINEVK